MKIRNPLMIRWVGLLGSWLVRLWMSTIGFRYRPQGPYFRPFTGMPERYIYAFWHENILLPCYVFARRDIKVLISEHADGEMIAQASEHIGFGTIRGSTTRGGVKAMRKMLKATENCHIAVIPDGPRGPRRHLEVGLVYLAAKTGLPVVVFGVGYDRPWRLKTWDRFALPRPFTRGVVVTADPIEVPKNIGREQFEQYRLKLEAELNRVSDLAEQMANSR